MKELEIYSEIYKSIQNFVNFDFYRDKTQTCNIINFINLIKLVSFAQNFQLNCQEKQLNISIQLKKKLKLKMQECQYNQQQEQILIAIFNAIVNLTREKSSDELIIRNNQKQKYLRLKIKRTHAEFNTPKNGNQQRNQQCQEYELQYQQNTIERDKQIAIIRDVQNIIATKIEVVTCFVQENNLF